MRPGPSIERMTCVRRGGFGRGATSRPVRLAFPSSPAIQQRRQESPLVDGRARRSVNSDARPTAIDVERLIGGRIGPVLKHGPRSLACARVLGRSKAERLNESERRDESHPL